MEENSTLGKESTQKSEINSFESSPKEPENEENFSSSSTDDVEWDGSEAELILEDDMEEYEEKNTGAKIRYILSEEEIIEIFKHTKGYQKNKELQKKHIIIQGGLFIVLLVLWLFMKNNYYALLMLMPLFCIGVILWAPIFSMKRLARDFYSGEEINLEIYPDKIQLSVKGKEREVPLDSTLKYEEIAGMIVLYPKEGDTLLIPIRAIEPEFLPDIQAMIFAGAEPKREEN